MNSSVLEYTADNAARLVYQLVSTLVSPARNQISSARRASSATEDDTFLGSAIRARAYVVWGGSVSRFGADSTSAEDEDEDISSVEDGDETVRTWSNVNERKHERFRRQREVEPPAVSCCSMGLEGENATCGG